VLISTLESAKSKAVAIAEQQEEVSETAQELEKVAAGYRPAAKRGSVLFFSMAGMSNIMAMYEYALSAYLKLFHIALNSSKRDPHLPNRLRNIVQVLTKTVYDYVCTGIFERHKLMFSLQMCAMIMAAADQLDRTEFDFFLKGNVSLADPVHPVPAEWVSSACWKDLEALVSAVVLLSLW
jgi:dynein heavy chain